LNEDEVSQLQSIIKKGEHKARTITRANILLLASEGESDEASGTPAFSVYSATKASVRLFARNWTLNLRERMIQVNAISPSVVPTPGYDHLGL
jgi:NAD(P)-dependent dehydrogenase (short-subunit alcohol dehydrogenase family)